MNEHEAALLSGAMFATPEQILTAGVSTDDFSCNQSKLLWSCVHGIASRRESVDVLAVIGELGEDYRGLVARISGGEGIPSSMPRHAVQVKREAKRREVSALLAEAGEIRDPDEAVGHLMARCVELGRGNAVRDLDMGQIMSLVADDLDRSMEAANKGETVGIPTGLIDLDQRLGGLAPSDLIVVAARPAMGKTAFMLSCAARAAKAGHPVGIVSAEMAAAQIGSRWLAGASQVGGHRLRSGRLSESDTGALTAAMARLREYPIRVMDPDVVKPSQIVQQAHVWAAQGIKCIWVDYLQLLRPDQKHDQRTREVGEISRTLKSLAKQLNIPVVALAQLNRGVEQRQDKRPMMSDLRDSGEIEQDADEVLFLYRPCVYDDKADPTEAELILAKNRHGPTGVISCRYVPDRMLWANTTREAA